MTDESGPADMLYDGIESLSGWSSLLKDSRETGGAFESRVGSFISSLLLAVGEDRNAIAVAGSVSDKGSGFLVVVCHAGIAYADVVGLRHDADEFRITVFPFAAVISLSIRTRHNYFGGTKERARQNGIEVGIEVGEKSISLQPSPGGTSPLSNADAVHAAFLAIRDARALLLPADPRRRG